MSNIPPKQTLGGLPPDASSGYENLAPQGLVLHDAAHGDANAFPVLKAFQDYLEMERQQARKRLVTLTVFFVSLMTLVVAGFIVAFIFLFNNMSKNENHLIDLALRQRQEAAAPTAALEQQAAKEFAAAAQAIQTNLSSQLASVGSVATRLDNKVESQNAEMTKLRNALATLQKENASLRTDLPKLAADAARRVQPQAPAAPPPTPATAGTAAQPPTATAGTPAAASGRTPAGCEEAVLTVRSRNGDTIPWRAFLPK